MAIFLTVIITILVIVLLQILLLALSKPYIKKIIDDAIDVSCYINTYHYNKEEWDRIKIGQDRYCKLLFNNKVTSFRKDKTDFIFWILYTQIFSKLLNCIPVKVNMHNNRCLSEGEQRGTERFLDEYLKEQEKAYQNYATLAEVKNREDMEATASVEENSEA